MYCQNGLRARRTGIPRRDGEIVPFPVSISQSGSRYCPERKSIWQIVVLIIKQKHIVLFYNIYPNVVVSLWEVASKPAKAEVKRQR